MYVERVFSAMSEAPLPLGKQGFVVLDKNIPSTALS